MARRSQPQKDHALTKPVPTIDLSVADNADVSLLSGESLARNTMWNALAIGLPLVAAVVALPVLLNTLGTERLGLLGLAWVLIGYLSFLDLGLGRALTQSVAQALGRREHSVIPNHVYTFTFVAGLSGLLGAIALALLAGPLVNDVLRVSVGLRDETVSAFRVLAIGVPVVIISTGLRGVLEAYQRFAMVAAVRAPISALTFLAPVVVSTFTHSLVMICGSLVIVRAVGCIAHAWQCLTVEPSLSRWSAPTGSTAALLLRSGGWMTVSNVIAPLMSYIDRFLVGALISASAVAYYATPFDVVTKVSVIPLAVTGVLFPAFATSFARNGERTQLLLVRGLKYIFLTTLPVVMFVVTFAGEGLRIWLGPEFERTATTAVQLIATGAFFNSLAHVPHSLIQGIGRADLVAKFHLAELPLTILLLWVLVREMGIEGAAVTWVIRTFAELIGFMAIGLRLSLIPGRLTRSGPIYLLGASLALALLGTISGGLLTKSALFIAITATLAGITWLRFLDSNERAAVRLRFRTAT